MTTTVTGPGTVPGQESPGTSRERADGRRWAALITLLVAVFMDLMDGNVSTVAIPVIQRDLGAGYAAIQWMGAGYVLAFALLLITGGRLGDIYGRKRIFQIGVLGFVLASLLCGIAANPQTLAAARLLQGAMAGLMVPQVLSIIHVTFPPREQGKVFAIYGLVGGVAATAAPLIGGLLVNGDNFGLGWRTVFLVNLPIGIAGFLLGWKYLAESKAPVALRLDLTGVGIGTLALVLLMFPLTVGRDLGWPAWTFVAIAASFATLVGFTLFERAKQRGGGSPLVPLNLFKARSFSAGLALQAVFYLMTSLFFLSWYLFMQTGLGWSPLHAGSTALAFCIGTFLTSAASVTVLVPKFGRAVLQVGAVLMVLGFAAFLWITGASGEQITTWQMAVPLLMLGLGFGAVASPIPQFALADVPHKDAGAASGLINTMQQLGLALGVALVGVAFFSPLGGLAGQKADALTPRLHQELVAAGIPAADADSIVAATFRACAVDRLNGEDPTATPESCLHPNSLARNPQAVAALEKFGGQANAESFAGAFRVALASSAAVVILVLLLTFGLPRKLEHHDPEVAAAP